MAASSEAVREKGTGTICRNGPEGASHKWCRSLFPLPPSEPKKTGVAGALRPKKTSHPQGTARLRFELDRRVPPMDYQRCRC